MKCNTLNILWFCLVLLSGAVFAQTGSKALRIYMPRNIEVKDAIPSLGQIAILRGEETLVNKLRGVPMGRISAPGSRVVIDRNTILSRLASHGVNVSDVTLSGAEKITVQQQSMIVTSADLVKRAREALKDFPLSDAVCQVSLTRAPADVVVPGSSQPLSLKIDTIKQISSNQIRIRLEVLQGEKSLAFRDVILGLRFRYYRLVAATVDVPPGTAIDPTLVRVVEGVSNRLVKSTEGVLWHKNAQGKRVVKEGLTALRRLPAGAVIRPGMIGLPEKKIMIKRRQGVVIRLESPGLMVSAMGVAQEPGSVGDVIKVKNADPDSHRLIMAQINADGSVTPVL